MRRVVLGIAFVLACGARTELASRAPGDASVDAPGDGGAGDAKADVQLDGAPDAPIVPCPALAKLVPTGAKPDTVALDGGYVYWHDENGVFRVPKSGGTAQIVGDSPASFWPTLVAFAIANGYVFFGGPSGQIARVPVSGGAPEILAFSLPQPAFAASSSYVYAWSQQGGATKVVRFGFDGSGPTQVDYLQHPPNEMVFGPKEMAYATADPDVRRMDYSQMGGLDTLLSGLSANDIVPSEPEVYFTSNDSTNGARVMVLSTSTLKGNPIPDTFGAYALVDGGSDLYFTDGNGLRVRRIAGKKGAVKDVASVGPDWAPIDLAVDDSCVYWTNASRTDPNAPGVLMVAPR